MRTVRIGSRRSGETKRRRSLGSSAPAADERAVPDERARGRPAPATRAARGAGPRGSSSEAAVARRIAGRAASATKRRERRLRALELLAPGVDDLAVVGLLRAPCRPTTSAPRRPPTGSTCPGGTACRRSAFRARPRGPAAGCGGCGRGARGRPCSCASACGRRRSSRPSSSALWKWCFGDSNFSVRWQAGADAVRRALDLQVVRVVAVRAGDAGRVHLALEERAVLVDLVLDLAVGEVEALLEERRPVRLQERLAVDVVVGDDRAPRVAPRAGLDLGARGAGDAALRDAGLHVHVPGGLARGPGATTARPLSACVLASPSRP